MSWSPGNMLCLSVFLKWFDDTWCYCVCLDNLEAACQNMEHKQDC